ncbi:vacuolar targeting, actin-related protein [Scheffersomyces xylosifermentans]|uniref:vacuolar targeting, actin-related protein n=1 Tax=Scheffersomyces xylosifermentans TaxID=1304137 RepID=UPI00315C5AEF
MAPSKVKIEEPELPPQEVHLLKDSSPPTYSEPFYSNYQTGVPIALDIGTSTFKVGLTNSDRPNNVFPAVAARYRERKSLRNLILVGNDVYRDPLVRSSIKAPFDGPLVTSWDHIELMLDYSLEHLSVTSDNGRLNNPVIMTEPVAVPSSQRKNYYELLFEAYQAPKVVFGIDSLFSYYANSSGNSSGIVIGTGNESTHIIPVLHGKGILSQTKRIDFGGDQAQQFLSKVLALKYPYFPSKLNTHHTTNLFKDYCYVSTDYKEEINHILDMDVLEEKDIVVQAPVEISVGNEKKKSEEELARQAEKRREQGRRLQEQAQQKRLEKLVQKQEEWDYYTKFREESSKLNKTELQARLNADGFDDLNDFNKYMASLEKSLKKAHNQDIGEDDNHTVDPTSAWPLVDIPDDQLNEEEIKEKRKQRLHKANYDARERTKELKRQQEEEKAQYEREQQEWRDKDLEDWCTVKRLHLAGLVSKYRERAKLLESFKDRKSMAAQQRMKNIADLANDESGSTSSATRKRRRNANTSIDNDPNDTFGANDDDWAVYRDITNVNIEEQQEETNNEILSLEEELLKYDPNFHHEDTFAASMTFDWKNSVLHKFIHGPRQNISIAMAAEGIDPEEIANHPEIIRKNHQIHLNVERIRVPEILFQPNIAGLDQAGISEISSDLLLHQFDGKFEAGGDSYSLIQDVFVTGGLALLPNFSTRIVNDFTSFLPVGAPLKVRRAQDPVLDAWKGMKKWSESEECENGYVTKEEYEEYGPEYIKEHGLGNVCLQ